MDTAEIGKRTRQENRRLTWLAVKQNKASYLMIAPFMLFFLVFTIVPVLMSLPMGFTDFNMVQMPKFIGLSNYTTLFLADKVFIQSIRVTLVFALSVRCSQDRSAMCCASCWRGSSMSCTRNSARSSP